jgi:hypothetical protein
LMASGGVRYEIFWSISGYTDETGGAVPYGWLRLS